MEYLYVYVYILYWLGFIWRSSSVFGQERTKKTKTNKKLGRVTWRKSFTCRKVRRWPKVLSVSVRALNDPATLFNEKHTGSCADNWIIWPSNGTSLLKIVLLLSLFITFQCPHEDQTAGNGFDRVKATSPWPPEFR